MNSELITYLNSKLEIAIENKDDFTTLLLLSRDIDEVIKGITIQKNHELEWME
ncbi:hypothetical protein [Sporosalibacterium faouarense]|uniref:hypothetical protein n=1 Tax=Sporosalibacterium faouarense TaxID=516123 RepID=UPI00192B0C58|nr:hypothetical protein [Sporosalibacterium faouarense]